MRLAPILMPLALVACTGAPPPTAANGFGGYDAFAANQQAALAGTITAGPIGAPLSATAVPGQPAVPAAPPSGVAAATPAVPEAISDEQDFAAVAARETIESDAARIAANRQQYQEIAPQPLPPRTDAGPNIVAYALSVTNRVGQPVWRRSALALANHDRACAGYASPDLAQQDFLRRGGPERDARNLDPDGDGFACAWDPTPFQRARAGG